ncbi:MAG: arylsulfatase, partial [Kiritimatiellaceae bacterium]|nr:arylsulfatase [Kiritimatiellaceae bacterium]
YATPLIPKDRMTIAQMLKDKGYQTGMVGKWHLGMEWPGKDGKKLNALSFKRRGKKQIEEFEKQIDWKGKIVTPRANGFDYYFGDGVPNFAPYCWIENDHMVGTPTVLKPKGMHGRHGLMQEGWTFEQILPKLTEKSVEYIKEAAPKDEPYFLYVPLTSPHTPINPSADFQGKSGVSIYADFVIETDWVVGQIIDAIDASGEADNTLVIFTADNGTSKVANFNELKAGGIDIRAKFRGYKMQIYEGGHRVPLMVRWPKHIKAGTRNNQTVCLNDFFATFAELTGYQIQDNEGEDSYSILPLITGKSETLPGHPAIVHHDYGGQFAIRSKQWKLIIPKNNKGSQLFNMVDDVREQKNIAGQHPEVVEELSAALQKIIDDGRTTKGEVQQNYNGETSWIGTPGNPGPKK